MFCAEGQSLNMLAPTKQNLLCRGKVSVHLDCTEPVIVSVHCVLYRTGY